MKKRKIRKSTIIIAAVFLLCILINITARLSKDFSDFYRARVFPVIQSGFSRVSGAAPFSIAEILVYIVLIVGISGIITGIAFAAKAKKKKSSHAKKTRAVFKNIALAFCLYLAVTLTLNFSVLYHCSTFAEQYGITENRYTSEQLLTVSRMLIDRANKSAKAAPRDENGVFTLTCDLNAEAKAAMLKLSDEYPSLKGYYPGAKPVRSSYFMMQINLLGIYTPFTLEANYNAMSADCELPATVCHELAHLKGWMPEDEANFIAFLACIDSGNPEFEYSGYLSAITYIENKIWNDAGIEPEVKTEVLSMIDKSIDEDLKRSREIFTEAQSAPIGKAAAAISDAAIEASLVVNGVSDGAKSYGRLVDLIMSYYLD